MAVWTIVLSTCVALQLSAQPRATLLADKKVNQTKVAAGTETTVEMIMVAGCGRNPGAGMNPKDGFTTIYKDGYFHVRCMMDEMFKIANYHDELTRVHEYKVKTNVSIVKYAERVDVEKQVKMTPRICFDFCRTIPDMSQFGLVYGRECYCTPYYHQVPGDGVCSSPCEGDNAVTCGNQDGMADVYEMHTCGDTVSDAQKDVDDMKEMLTHAHSLAQNATFVLHGLDDSVDHLNVEELRHPVMNASRDLAALIRPLKEAIGHGESSSEDLDDYLATVSDGTTNAHKVLRIEAMQDRVNEAANSLKENVELVSDWLAAMSSASAFKNAGITKTSAKDMGEQLANFAQLIAVDPLDDADLEAVKSAMNCGDDLYDCENDLSYAWFPNAFGPCRDVQGGYFRSSEVVGEGTSFNELQKQTVLTCSALCETTDVCHFFLTYSSLTDRRDGYNSYMYIGCNFYTIPDPSNCASQVRSVEAFEPYVHGPTSYYYFGYAYYYYYYYYYDSETQTGNGYANFYWHEWYYTVEYDYTEYEAAHFGIKNSYKDCVGAITATNVETVSVGL